MKKFLSIIIAAFSVFLVVADADAAQALRRRRQRRQAAERDHPAAGRAEGPAQQQNQAAPATPAQQPSGMSKWLGPLAGLAIGAGLASLFFNNGMGGALAGMLMMGLLVAAAIFAVRYFMRGRTAPAAAAAVRGRRRGAGRCRRRPRCPEAPARSPSPPPWAARAAPAGAPAWPAGFDAAAFTRQAKLNFVNMQAANDKRDLVDHARLPDARDVPRDRSQPPVGVGDAAEDGGRNARRRGARRDHRKRSVRRERALHRA